MPPSTRHGKKPIQQENHEDDGTLEEAVQRVCELWSTNQLQSIIDTRRAWRKICTKYLCTQNQHIDAGTPTYDVFPAWALASLPRRFVHVSMCAEFDKDQLGERPLGRTRLMQDISNVIRDTWAPGALDQQEGDGWNYFEEFDDTFTLLALTFGVNNFGKRIF